MRVALASQSARHDCVGARVKSSLSCCAAALLGIVGSCFKKKNKTILWQRRANAMLVRNDVRRACVCELHALIEEINRRMIRGEGETHDRVSEMLHRAELQPAERAEDCKKIVDAANAVGKMDLLQLLGV